MQGHNVDHTWPQEADPVLQEVAWLHVKLTSINAKIASRPVNTARCSALKEISEAEEKLREYAVHAMKLTADNMHELASTKSLWIIFCAIKGEAGLSKADENMIPCTKVENLWLVPSDVRVVTRVPSEAFLAVDTEEQASFLAGTRGSMGEGESVALELVLVDQETKSFRICQLSFSVADIQGIKVQ